MSQLHQNVVSTLYCCSVTYALCENVIIDPIYHILFPGLVDNRSACVSCVVTPVVSRWSCMETAESAHTGPGANTASHSGHPHRLEEAGEMVMAWWWKQGNKWITEAEQMDKWSLWCKSPIQHGCTYLTHEVKQDPEKDVSYTIWCVSHIVLNSSWIYLCNSYNRQYRMMWHLLGTLFQ